MPHWLTPVCDDHPVSQPISRWLPSRSQRWRVGTSPERSARSSTGLASPSICTKTTPGTSVSAAIPECRRARRAIDVSNQASSSKARRLDTTVVTAANPSTITSGAHQPSSVTPGSVSSTRVTTIASSTIAPSPSVSTEIGTTMTARAGHTMALTMPITNPARSACHHSSIAKSSSTAASSHNVNAPMTVTRMTRHTTTRREGRSATGRSAGAAVRSGVTPPPADVSRSPGSEHADVVEQPDAIELGAEPLDGLQQPRRRPAADDRRAVGPPVDRDDQPGVEDPHRLGGACGIEVALADASDPNPRSGAGRRPPGRSPTSRRTGRCRRRSTRPGRTTAARSRRPRR